MEHGPTSIPLPEREGQHAEYEHKRADWERQLPVEAFDLEKLGPERLAVLIEALDKLAEKSAPDAWADQGGPNELLVALGVSMERLVEQDPEAALRLFWSLIDKDDYYVKAEAISRIAKPFINQYGEIWDPEERSRLVNKWAGLLRDDDDLVRDIVHDTLPSNVKPEWVDDETAALLDEKLVAQGWR